MKLTIELLVSVEIDSELRSDADVLQIARHKLARVAEVGSYYAFQVVGTAPLTREQSLAIRMVTATAKNGGSVPQTMDEVADAIQPILGAPQRQGGPSWFVADSRGGGA